MRAIIYLRVSKEDKDGKSGLSRQHQQIQSYLSNHPITIIDTITCDGISGTLIDENQKLQELLSKLNDIDAVIISEIDRLIRPKDFASLGILDTFHKSNTLIITTTKTYDLNNSTDRFQLAVMTGVAGLELALIKTRTYEAKKKHIQDGRKVAGRNPLGYTFSKQKNMFVFNDDINKLKEVINLVKQGKSLRDVGRKTGKNWQFVMRALSNPILYGKWPTQMDGQEYTIMAEQLMSKDEWDSLQTILQKRKKVYAGKEMHKYPYLLSNLIFTTEGDKLYGHAGKYYGSCKTHKYIRTNLIEDSLIEHLEQNRDYYLKTVFQSRKQKNQEEIELEERLLFHKKEIIKVEGKINRLIDLYAEGEIYFTF